MDDYLQWLFAGFSLLLLLGWLGHRVCKRIEARRRSERAAAEAAARAEALRAKAEEAARQQAARKTAAMQAARAEAARLARAEAARAEADRVAAAKEAVRAAAAKAASEQAARAEVARLAAEEAARLAAARMAAQEAARAEAAGVAAAQAARAQAARLAAERAARAEAEAARLVAQEAARAVAARAAADEAARLEAERQQAVAAVPTPPTPTVAAKTPDQMLVMVADDSKLVRIKTGRLLAQHNYRVSYAADGLDAAQQLQTSLPDVVITDVEMPGMDGFELTRHVRQNPLTARIPIIMITAANDRHREDADRAGVNVLLGKPYADEELIAHIRLATNRNESHPHTGF